LQTNLQVTASNVLSGNKNGCADDDAVDH